VPLRREEPVGRERLALIRPAAIKKPRASDDHYASACCLGSKCSDDVLEGAALVTVLAQRCADPRACQPLAGQCCRPLAQ
jgi:hypothetical protein